jgi:CBS domain-containing protein
MSKNLVTLTPEHSVSHAAQIMLEHRVSGVPVVDDDKVVGILTEGDLLRRIELGSDTTTSSWLWLAPSGAARDFVRTRSWRVADVMSTPVVTVGKDMPLADAAVLLSTRGIKRVPVLHDGALVGILRRADLLKIVARSQPERATDGSDEALLIGARARVGELKILAVPLSVSVVRGVVHLWGSVRSQAERDAARVAVETMPGVVGVEDHLKIE